MFGPQVFNCGTDRYIGYKGLVIALHKHFKNNEEDVRVDVDVLVDHPIGHPPPIRMSWE